MRDMLDITGKRALITGASSGLGRHFGQTMAKAGAEIVIVARRIERLAETAAMIEADGGGCTPLSLDISDTGSVAELASAMETMDILVNNAGVVREAHSWTIRRSIGTRSSTPT